MEQRELFLAPTVLQGGNRRGKPDRMSLSLILFLFFHDVCAILLSIAAVRAIPD